MPFAEGNIVGKKHWFKDKGGKKPIVCPNCGEIHELYPSDIKRGRKFCSFGCAMSWQSKHYRGEKHHRYKEDFREIKRLRNCAKYKEWRRKILERDDYKCQMCDTDENLMVHHIISLIEDKSKVFDIDNGITVCVECHQLLHPELKVDMRKNPIYGGGENSICRV